MNELMSATEMQKWMEREITSTIAARDTANAVAELRRIGGVGGTTKLRHSELYSTVGAQSNTDAAAELRRAGGFAGSKARVGSGLLAKQL
jgi:GH24 family phage-related lysozyme (muramidase)